MPELIEWPADPFFEGAIAALRDTDVMPLMEQWEDVIVEGNRRGVLSGLDGNNQPMPPLKYRTGKGRKTRNRKLGTAGRKTSETPITEGIAGPFSGGFDLNLTTAQYQQLTGPRLAPRREQSRVITQLHTAIFRFDDGNRWEVIGAWADVVSRQGVPFLPFHFEGMGHNPKYDLRPVRPEDVQFCLNYLDAFIRQEFLRAF